MCLLKNIKYQNVKKNKNIREYVKNIEVKKQQKRRYAMLYLKI